MTDRLIVSSQELRAEGEDLSTEIERHGKAFYDRLTRMQQRLHAELRQVESLMHRFSWANPSESAGNSAIGRTLQDQRRALQAVQPKDKAE